MPCRVPKCPSCETPTLSLSAGDKLKFAVTLEGTERNCMDKENTLIKFLLFQLRTSRSIRSTFVSVKVQCMPVLLRARRTRLHSLEVVARCYFRISLFVFRGITGSLVSSQSSVPWPINKQVCCHIE